MKSKSANVNEVSKVIALCILFLLIISCSKEKTGIIPLNNTNKPDTIINKIPLDTSIKSYLALGDSYTIGQSVSDSGRFPVQVVDILRSENVSISDPDIIAYTGWTTSNLLNALNEDPPKHTYSFVTLLIGVNNQYQGRSLEEYKTEFSQLLNLAISYANNNKNHVIVLSIPDYSVTPFAQYLNTQQISQEIDEFNTANKTISQSAGVQYLDITQISREAKSDPSLVAGDGLHPSAKQYHEWDELLAPLMFNSIH